MYWVFFKDFIWERQHESKEGQREREMYTPCWAGSLMWGSIPEPQDHDLSWSRNWSFQLISRLYHVLFIKTYTTNFRNISSNNNYSYKLPWIKLLLFYILGGGEICYWCQINEVVLLNVYHNPIAQGLWNLLLVVIT